MSEVLVAAGKATGMFFKAPKGTAAPATPGTAPGADWTNAGDISEDGISLKLPSGDVLRNWALAAKRKINTENGVVSAPIMDTTRTVLETLFGEGNVSTTAATSEHGNITSVELSPDVSAEPAAYLFLMKDGDTLVSLYSPDALITEIADVPLKGTEAAIWNVSIDGAWTFAIDDGAVTS